MKTGGRSQKVTSSGGRQGIVKVYTRHGDRGMTDVPAVGRASKDSPRVTACGSLDELNCMIGELRARIDRAPIAPKRKPSLMQRLRQIQRDLLSMGSLVSGAVAAGRGATAKNRRAIERFENEIDEMQQGLPPLRGFILPGGDLPSAGAHMARAFCRRAERASVAAIGDEPPGEIVIPYLNRLSDWFFVLARWLANELGHVDEPWKKRPNAKARGKRQ